MVCLVLYSVILILHQKTKRHGKETGCKIEIVVLPGLLESVSSKKKCQIHLNTIGNQNSHRSTHVCIYRLDVVLAGFSHSYVAFCCLTLHEKVMSGGRGGVRSQ